ncbi:MAG: HDIG domain-containing protein, partial [Myxococcales bacterium]|nr:HDIG domain-containing protein [Myxococcales bacterium]
GVIKDKQAATLTIRTPMFRGYDAGEKVIGNGGYLIARGQEATADDEHNAAVLRAAQPRGALPYVALGLLAFVLAAVFTHHMRRSTKGRLLRVQLVGLVAIAVLAIAVKILLLTTAVSVLVVPVALLALVPTLALDRVVGLATGILGALTVALLGPFDVGVAIILLVQAAVAGLVVAEQPKDRWRAVLAAGSITTLFTAATCVLLVYLTTGHLPAVRDPIHTPWFAAALGPAIATVLAVPLLPLYQMLVGEITRGKLIELEDLSNPLLKQIAEKSPGTWQHSLMMANMAEIAANAIGASGRLVRVGAYYHDLGKSLQPKYFIENLEPGETSPHDQLPPEVSCDAIFAHVTEGIVAARKAGLHERIVDFMHMHHGDGVLEYFWGKCKEQGNPRGLAIEQFRYPGHPPQSRETAILAICDAVEAASRTLKKPDAQSIDTLVQRIVYGKLHLGQLDESGLSMSDLRRISDSLKETIRHANHGRIEYPWQKAQQDASASKAIEGTAPRLDSLDRSPAERATAIKAKPAEDATTSGQTTNEIALAVTAPTKADLAIVETAPARSKAPTDPPIELVSKRPSEPPPPVVVRIKKPTTQPPPVSAPAPTPPPPEPVGLKPDEAALADLSARKPPTQPPPDGLITSATFGPAAPSARKRAATLPPTPLRRAPSVPPPLAPGRRSSPTIPPLEPRTAGPPSPVDLDNAVTNPPPLRGRPSTRPPMPYTERPSATPHEDVTMPAMRIDLEDAGRTTQPLIPAAAIARDAATTSPSLPKVLDLPDAGRTDPSMPAFAHLKSPAPAMPVTPGLAARIDAQVDRDEWNVETPIKAPTPAELRALLGQPDPTMQQSLDDIDRLHAEAAAQVEAEEAAKPEILSRRPPMPTSEVDDDDIEAAIEIAPPARRLPNAIAVAKKKKSE